MDFTPIYSEFQLKLASESKRADGAELLCRFSQQNRSNFPIRPDVEAVLLGSKEL